MSGLSNAEVTFLLKAQKDARKAFRVLRQTRVISPSGTISFLERIPGTEKLINLGYNGPWGGDLDEVQLSVFGLDGTVYLGDARAGGGARYAALFHAHADVTSLSHVHTPHLGAYAQAHATLPFLYVPVQRHRFVRELPVYVNRLQPEVEFILDQLKRDPEIPGIVEANGGATVWGRNGLLRLADLILLLEEGAQLQILATGLGGSKPLGPGVLQQQWRMSGLIPRSATVDQDGVITYAEAAE
ncbi:class II aldolase/adducin family protein [Sphingomonas jatrophae]|uniref:Ribulose-5-phosphate 4-epimerase/Fuculose-1-phosphate aldolase n=1 Tax=Sphingomonas jatrophae TaxID=1166337 RepID=A0A1I6KAS0_9SPHN|nr:class II aldolase/adducin family protein [Sphingomonas jatrophae]SFR88118.1 Ribulose-5-phosphate 4-epimerase/Fuculose-1-phosphate aldolase [Sphingomonas jatrophae]